MAQESLAELLVGLERTVVPFDVPGTWTVSDLNLGPNQTSTTTLVVQVDPTLTGTFTITNADYRVFGANVYTGAVGLPVVNLGGEQQISLPIILKNQ